MVQDNHNYNQIEKILEQVWKWSNSQDFKGYNKHDGLNSPILRTLLGWGKWPRLVAIQAVMRFPINIRPLLLIPKSYNPKGLALFALGCLDRYRATGKQLHLDRAQRLLELLLSLSSPGKWSGICWGYHYPWQDLGFFAPTNTPNAVVTSFVCEAFLDAYRLTKETGYLDVVESASDFFINDLTVLLDKPQKLCLGYMPMPMKMRVMDVSILIGAVLAQLVSFGKRLDLEDHARRLVAYVVGQQTDYGAWYYTDPPEDSPIRHDNYHTGFILDALWRYMEALQEWDYQDSYIKGLEFYSGKLFNNDGSPRWMSHKDFPHDIHGAAQGILTFSKAKGLGIYNGQLDYKIYCWAIEHMYNDQGRFYYQRSRYWTKRFTLLRWCNAWMFRALTQFLYSNRGSPTNPHF